MIIRLTLAALTVAGMSTLAAPDPLAPYREFVGKFQQQDKPAGLVWETVFEAKPGGKQFWQAPTNQVEIVRDAETHAVSTKTEKLKDETVLTFDGVGCEAALLPVGPKVKDNVAIEIVCRSTGNRLNDLSLLLGGLDGPGFQFGGYNNSRNLLRADDEEGNWKRVEELPAEPLLERDRWYTVRLELVGRHLRGFVDGKKLGEVELQNPALLQTERQPVFYIYDSLAQVRRYTVQKPKTAVPANAADAARQAEIEAKVAGLIALLDHQEYKVRNGAQELLKTLGHHARIQLRAVLDKGTTEQQLRARELLGIAAPAN